MSTPAFATIFAITLCMNETLAFHFTKGKKFQFGDRHEPGSQAAVRAPAPPPPARWPAMPTSIGVDNLSLFIRHEF